jgi:hypothetical protein
VNVAFLLVVAAAIGGVVSLLALKTVLPIAAPFVALGIMAAVLLGASRKERNVNESTSPL